METDAAKNLADAKRAVLTAPAGCGKTHLIATAVARHARGRELILTHTHAGVDALRRKLRAMNVTCSSYHVDTIAGFALRYATAFPGTSGLTTFKPAGDAWNEVYGAAARLLRSSPVREIVQLSYAGLYVDEYQDCIREQHDLVLALADLLPCRVLGDPLQGIFDFGANTIIDWSRDVEASFDPLPELQTPWRWAYSNPELGSWLQEVRNQLLDSSSIDLQNRPVHYIQNSGNAQNTIQAQTNTCFRAAQGSGSVVAILQWPVQCHKVAQRLSGRYQSIEPIDCEDLMGAADMLENCTGPARAAAAVDFCKKCMTKVGTELRSSHQAFEQGRIPRITARTRHDAVIGALIEVATSDSLRLVAPAMKSIRKISGAILYRGELYHEMLRALSEFNTGEYADLREAAWATRNRTSHMGRRLSNCTVGRTVLVKGLEFDRAVVLDVSGMTAKNLYVALTRGSRSLTVLSSSPILNPSA